MKFVTFQRDGASEPGVLMDDTVVGLKRRLPACWI
jgi:hypothetical protein